MKERVLEKNYLKRRLYFDQMIARDLIKVYHKTNKSEGLQAGYVYLITNPAWPEWIKVGSAIDVYDRLSTYQTSCPMRDFKIEYYFFSFNRRRDEKLIIDAFSGKNEWIKCELDEVKLMCSKIAPFCRNRSES
ncbi:MAG: GIY-YIG nuclease family protein [Bacilli bacterium]